MKGMKNNTDLQEPPLWARFREFTRPLWEGVLDRGRLTARQRMVLGGPLFAGCAEFVYAVADGMGFDPALFAGVPVRAEPLQRRQDRALDMLIFSHGLREMADRAYDEYLREQSGAVRDAMAVMQRTQQDAQLPLLSEEERARIRCRIAQLWPAQKVLSDRQRRNQHKALKKKSRKGA